MNFTTLFRERRERADSHRAMLALAAILGALLPCLPLFSQGNQGTIQGSVLDQTGGAIAGATVTIIDVARGISRPLTTDSAGAYVASNLTPSTYTVRGEAKGFQTLEHANVLVEVGQNVRVDLTLQPGAQTQTVTVTSDIPSIDTTDATLGGTVANTTINALPLNGRNFTRLLALRPGVVTPVGGGSGTASTNGLRTGDDLQLIDGIAAMTASTGNSILNASYRAGDSTSLLPIDAIQEFNVEQNPKAEYGWKDGSIVNVGLKSGTNSIHGTAYAFGRDDAWDAANPFTFAPTPLALKQFGATAGGPIIKNKLFWFAGYEGLDWSVGTVSTVTIPSDIPLTPAQDANNQLSMVNACNAVGAANVNKLSAQISGLTQIGTGSCAVAQSSSTVENLWPNNGTTSTTYNPHLLTTSPGNNGIFKANYHISDHNEVDGMFFRGQQNEQAMGTTSPIWGTVIPAHTEAIELSWTWTPNSNWVNELRSGYAYINNYTLFTDASVNPAAPYPTGYGINTGVNVAQNPLYGGAPQIQIGGFTGYLGSGNKSSERGPEGDLDLVDHVSYLHGKHSFKFGFEFLDNVFDGNTYNQASGQVKFKNLQQFLLGTPQSGTILVGNPLIQVRTRNYAGFFQDDWRVMTRLTLNLGVRYSYGASPFERNNYIGNFNATVNPATTPAIQQAGPGAPLDPYFHDDRTDVSPRFGLAWDVQGNGRTVVRMGASILYAMLGAGDIIDTAPFGANFPTLGINTSGTALNAHTPDLFSLSPGQINWTNAPGQIVFPVTAPTTFNGITYTGVTCTPPTIAGGVITGGSPCPANVVAPNFHASSPTAEWNLDIQRAITNNLTVDIAYVGNHGWDEQSRGVDVNQPPLGWGWNTVNASTGGLTPAAFCLASAGTGYNHCTSNAVNNALVANEAQGEAFASQFPYLNFIDQQGNLFYSNYNGLQLTATERVTRGLSFLAGYTFSHALDVSSGQGVAGGPMDVRNIQLNYGDGNNDIRNRFTLSATYDVPGRKSPGQMLEGWSISPLVNLEGGLPWWGQDTSIDFAGTGEVLSSGSGAATAAFAWNYSGPRSAFNTVAANIPCFGAMTGCKPFAQLPGGVPPAVCMTAAQAPYAGNAQLQQLAVAALINFGCYVQNGGVMTPPAFGTLGNAGRNTFRGAPYYNVDLSIAKDWKFRERFGAQFRAEFFNLFNRTDLANPSTIDPSKGLGFGASTSTLNNSNPVLGSGGPRTIQLGLKLSF